VTTAQTKRRVSRRKALLFSACACIAFLALCEGALRLFGYSGYQIDFGVYRNVPGDITPRQRLVHEVPSVGVTYEITINSQGFRAPGRLRPKTPCRVLCLGDSSTMGYGVGDRETYPARVATFLEGAFPGIFDVINAGSIGYTINDEMSYLQEKGDMIKPDVVILEVFYNDVIELSFRKQSQRDFRRKALPYTPLASMMLKSALYQSLRNAYVLALARAGRYFPENPTDKMDMAMFPQRFPKEWEAYERELEKLADYLKARNIPLLLLISPHQYQVYSWGYPFGSYYDQRGYQDRIIEIARRVGIPYVDLLPILREEAKEEQAVFLTYGLYDEHESDIGQLLKARAVYPALLTVLENNGFYDFYARFDRATIRSLSQNGGVLRGRQWRSRGDAPSLLLRPNVALKFSNVHITQDSWLRFATGVAPWLKQARSVPLRLRVVAADESSTGTETLIYEAHIDTANKDQPIFVLHSLSSLAGKTVSLIFELTMREDQIPTGSKGEKIEVFVSNPIIFAAKRNPPQEQTHR
jgi:lysophospholipase L1-like esterase